MFSEYRADLSPEHVEEIEFIDFYDYADIIYYNRKIFEPIMRNMSNLKKWVGKVKSLDPIRNSIMHCRGQYLSAERISRLKESCTELQKLIEKVRKGAFQK